jgi:t-SNARE complex subunit (syntaxin)
LKGEPKICVNYDPSEKYHNKDTRNSIIILLWYVIIIIIIIIIIIVVVVVVDDVAYIMRRTGS